MSLIRTVLSKCFSPFTGAGSENCTTDVLREEESPYSSSFRMAGTSREDIYKKLVAVEQGDAHQILPAMDAISRGHHVDETLLFDRLRQVGAVRPYEAGHLLTRLFARASTKTRIAILGEFVSSTAIGDKHAVGDLFVTITEHSTREELRRDIYPSLYRIIEDTKEGPQPVLGKRAFLIALLKGSMSER